MDERYREIEQKPENSIFRVVFFPDRIYHAEYLAASGCERYTYSVRQVRNKSAITILKGHVYLDGQIVANFLRMEYRGERLQEASREKKRTLGDAVVAEINLPKSEGNPSSEVRLHYSHKISAYQVEIWDTLEPPQGRSHDFRVLGMMGAGGSITTVSSFTSAINSIDTIGQVEVRTREDYFYTPFGTAIVDPAWDDNYQRNHQFPTTQQPNSHENTIMDRSYLIDFQLGWYMESSDVLPVRYENAMMDGGNPDRQDGNIVEMRWLLQRELGGNLVFFHEVTVPPGVVEGTHRHIGSEELYYVVSGEGIAYMGVDDDPSLADHPVVERQIFGIGTKRCREINVKPGSVIFTKSGGIHGIRNPGDEPLVFVAFLYQGS